MDEISELTTPPAARAIEAGPAPGFDGAQAENGLGARSPGDRQGARPGATGKWPPGGPLSASEQRRAAQLRVGKRRATGLLIAVTAVFVAATALSHAHPWLSWVQATAVASMVGALADWFAVTALFRRPLGLPIPHTAIVVERKDRFAETLGAFVQESFLSPDAVVARLHASDALRRSARWLADPAHAEDLAGRFAGAMVAGADVLGDEDVQSLIVSLGSRRLQSVPVAPVAGRLLRRLTKEGRLDPVVDAALVAAGRYLEVHGPGLHARLGVRSPWWVPGPVEARMAARLLRQARTLVAEMAADRHHPLRVQLDAGLAKLADDLEHSPELRARGEALKAEVLAQPQVRELVGALWLEVKDELRAQASQPGSELRRQLARGIAQSGRRLLDEPDLAASAQRGLDAAARTVFARLDKEVARLVSGTISRWDATETSRRLELLLGPDLQFIRINGTVIGGAAGLALHAVSQLLAR